jgi:uncharacterized protein (TIGR03435 family)
VKESKADSSGCDSDFDHGRFTSTGCPVKELIEYEGYGIPSSRILGGPKWIVSQRFDIAATMDSASIERLSSLPSAERRKQTQAIFQRLLAERFKLSVHWESRVLPVYALVVSKQGPKFQATKTPEGHSGTSSNNGKFSGRGLTMAQLADAMTRELGGQLGRPVIDKTGLQGRYDFELRWTPDRDAISVNDAKDGSGIVDTGPSIFTDIQEQMGLKLESTKGPVKVLVIDHAEIPTEN